VKLVSRLTHNRNKLENAKMKDAYFIVDDVMQNRNREGFGVMLGNPYTAIGTFQAEFVTLAEAETFIKNENGESYYRVFLARRHGSHKVKFVRIGGMLVFENGLDIRSRTAPAPEVAKIHVSNGMYRFCVIGTEYGHWHTTGGDVRTWKTESGARHAIKRYKPL
jgi:hypothetical protein